MAAKSSAQIKMLSIDDRMLTTDLDRAGYRNMGITVRHATTFAEAQQILNSESINIIVINLDYEKIDALGITKHFKAHRPINDIPVVLTSVQTSSAARKSAEAVGADLFVEQPLPRQYFIERLKKLLDQSTRTNDRVEVEETAKLEWDGREIELPIGDLSISGMLILDEKQVLPEGSKVKVSFTLPGQKKPFEVEATAVRRVISRDHKHAKGVGLRFDVFSGDAEKRLEKYVQQSSGRDEKLKYYL
jgi:response regulator RpfG family c-di-GMP phosphodiesterase